MPRTQQIISGTATNSPRPHSLAFNDVVNALSQKLNTSVNVEPLPTRRTSFSMDSILHPGKKEKKRDSSKEREAKKEKRMSLTSSKASKSKDKHSTTSPRMGPVRPAKFDLIVESPPLVFFGSASNSSGALFSGRLKLIVDDPSGFVKFNDFDMVLRATLTTHKPISKDCKQCAERHDELKKWTLISEPTTYLKAKDNQFPFSYLFPGHLPASTEVHAGSLTYSLYVVATTITGEKIEFIHPLKIQRAIPPGPEKSSIRIFPPTNLTGRVQLPPIVHPIGTFPVKMVLSGVVEKRAESQTRWRLRKMMWRIEENTKVISSPCVKHQNKVSDGKAMQHSDHRTLHGDEMKSGWKTDFDTHGGEITLEFEAALASTTRHRVTCDMESPAGLEVKHVLIVELIVAEEFCPNRNTSLITPTGAARVLRMQFNLQVTERSGMGISWDEEMPPMYEDVPPSPPGYGKNNKNEEEFAHAVATMEDYSGPTIVPHDLERLSTTGSDGLPHYRERELDELDNDSDAGLPMRNRRDTNESGEIEASSRRRLAALRLDDLEAESAADAYRRRRLEQTEEDITEEEDYGEGSAGDAPTAPTARR